MLSENWFISRGQHAASIVQAEQMSLLGPFAATKNQGRIRQQPLKRRCDGGNVTLHRFTSTTFDDEGRARNLG